MSLPPDRLIRISRYLSKHLRHQPERLGLVLAPGGWVPVPALLDAAARDGFPITPQELAEVVARNDKQRFALDAGGARIRANQGHSVPIDLQLEPAAPPPVLYHGTGAGNAERIDRTGLQRMARHHVHLSGDAETARRVGRRHGRPVVFTVSAAEMHAAGYAFFRSANGVWLVDAVPPQFLRRSPEA